jgi:hypothetical protein
LTSHSIQRRINLKKKKNRKKNHGTLGSSGAAVEARLWQGSIHCMEYILLGSRSIFNSYILLHLQDKYFILKKEFPLVMEVDSRISWVQRGIIGLYCLVSPADHELYISLSSRSKSSLWNYKLEIIFELSSFLHDKLTARIFRRCPSISQPYPPFNFVISNAH